jgi:hypothetical protein
MSSQEHSNEAAIIETVKHGGGSLMIWGCMTWQGPGYVVKIDGNMDKELYQEILDEGVKWTLRDYKINPNTFYFQHDNDPKHTASSTKQWLQQQNWKILDWPPQSPDLNPIEHLWRHLKVTLSKFEHPPINEDEHWKRVYQTYYAIQPEVCQDLISSMPRRIEAVLKAKGGHTKY